MKFVLIASTPWSIIPFRGKLIRRLRDQGVEVHICAPFTEEDRSTIQVLRNNYGVDAHTTPLARAGVNMLSDLRYLMKLVRL